MKEDPFAALTGEYCKKHKAFLMDGECPHCKLDHPEWKDGMQWDEYDLTEEVRNASYPGWLICMWIISIGISILGALYILG